MSKYHHDVKRPNKANAIRHAIVEGFKEGCLHKVHDAGAIYYTLGGVQFNDLKLFYNIFDGKLQRIFTFEKDSKVYPKCRAAAKRLLKKGDLINVQLETQLGDIMDSNLRLCPRQSCKIILFLDLTEFLTLDHQIYFQQWVVSNSLAPGDVVIITSSLPPWELVKTKFRAEVSQIMADQGIKNHALTDKSFFKRNYVKSIISYFCGDWQNRQLSARGFKHFYAENYKDTKIEMALNAFVIT